MEAVQHEAAASEPIPFPWVRALPVFISMAAVVAMLVAGFVELTHMPANTMTAWTLPPSVEHVLMQANAGWIAFALLLTLLSSLVSIRLAAGKR
jgi:multisubunit Na+/H+ antiporter MnhB subunit